MKAMELVRWALQLSDEGTAGLVEAMRETPMTPSTPGGKAGDGNHSIWTLGQLRASFGDHATFGVIPG